MGWRHSRLWAIDAISTFVIRSQGKIGYQIDKAGCGNRIALSAFGCRFQQEPNWILVGQLRDEVVGVEFGTSGFVEDGDPAKVSRPMRERPAFRRIV